MAIGTLGGIFSQLPLALVVHHFGWRLAVVFNVALGVGIWVLIVLFVKDNQEIVKKKSRMLSVLKKVLVNSKNWSAGAAAGLLNLPIFIFGALWGNYYLRVMHHSNLLTSSVISMMIYMGLLVGAPFWGIVSNKCQGSIKPALVGAVICIFAVVGFQYIGLSATYLGLCSFMIGFSSAAQILSYSIIAKFNHCGSIGTAEGLVTWLILGAGGIAQPLSGWLIGLGENNVIKISDAFSLLVWGLVITLVFAAGLYYFLARPERVKVIVSD